MAFGTNTTLDTAASRFQYANMRAAEFGLDRLADGIKVMFDAHNAQAMDLMGDLCGMTSERLMLYGTGDTTQMIELDEMGTPPPQKPKLGSVVGFPLKKYGYSWQGTWQYLRKATVGEVMQNAEVMMDADKRNLINQVRLAIFNPTNYTFSDDLVDHLLNTPIPVKRLVNADGLPIPPGPNGEFFDPTTHTHYLGTSSFAASDMVAVKETVLEHYASGTGMFCVSRPLANVIAGFTSNFVPMTPVSINPSITSANITDPRLDVIDISNREIGLFDGIPVWIKPWMPAGFVLFTLKNPGASKVCMIRTDPDTNGAGDLALFLKQQTFNLDASLGGREFGVGVLERTGCAILDTVHSSFTAPALLTY